MAVPSTQIQVHSTIGTRILVIGNSTSGKSTLGSFCSRDVPTRRPLYCVGPWPPLPRV